MTEEVAESDDDRLLVWAEVLAERSLEGRAVVEQLEQAERVVLSLQAQIFDAIRKNERCDLLFSQFEIAFAEVDRMRDVVFKMARH